MDPILGIDLGTTNSVVSIVREGKPEVVRDARGEAILPSVVGIDAAGQLLVGELARNQALVAPERTVRSIKRQMGDDVKVTMADQEFSPQEISAIVLKSLAERAEQAWGRPLKRAVITVPAFFGENQRQATREAGELAGLEVVRIINEPTAASLVYEPHSTRNERLLVYDLGGGTFDVSIVQIEQGVVEVLASHGDTHLGGDDFDQLLLDFVADQFRDEHGVDLRESSLARSRLLHAVEKAKKELSFEPFATITEEFIGQHDGQPLHLRMELNRSDYEELITPLLEKTLHCVDKALEDAKLNASELDRIILVGGSTRTPLVQNMLREQLHQQLHVEVDPDLCVALGAAVQGALIDGTDVGAILVDITPRTLGIQCVGPVHGQYTHRKFSAIIPRNTPLPAGRTELYFPYDQGQERVRIEVFQGEGPLVDGNEPVGGFVLEGLDPTADRNKILVRFDLDLSGLLRVTAEERETGLKREITVDNAISRFRTDDLDSARRRLAEMFTGENQPDAEPDAEPAAGDAAAVPPGDRWGAGNQAFDKPQKYEPAGETLAKARRLLSQAPAEDAGEMRELIGQLEAAIDADQEEQVAALRDELEDLVFYLQDA